MPSSGTASQNIPMIFQSQKQIKLTPTHIIKICTFGKRFTLRYTAICMKSSFALFSFVSSLALLGAGCNNAPGATPKTNETPAQAASTTVTSNTATSDQYYSSSTPPMTPLAFPGVLPASETNKRVSIKTTLGDIVVQLDPSAGPKAASNFVYLIKNNFYNGTIFHRVIPGFMIQGGDPTGTGMGGPGYKFENDPVNKPYNKGVIAMANAGRNTNGSQFFIMVADVPLPPDYSIFGQVVSGQNVADAISLVPRNRMDRPNTEVKMISVEIE